MEFFGRPPGEQDPNEEMEDDAEDPPENDDAPLLAAPEPLRASQFRKGELARRMMAVEDRMQARTDDTFAALLQVMHAAARDLVEVWTAYDRFCRDRLGVTAETMLAAWDFPTGDEVAAMLKRHRHVEPRQEKLEQYHGIYCRAWDTKFEGEDD
jgi:hypothetical protein